MALVTANSKLRASVSWKYAVPLTPFNPRRQGDSLSWEFTPGATLNHVFHYSGTLAAAADVTLDLRAFTALSGEVVTAAVRIGGFWLRCRGDGGQLKIEPAAANPLNWPFSSTGYRTLTPGSGDAGWDRFDGANGVISGTARGWKLTNQGTASLDVAMIVFVGT